MAYLAFIILVISLAATGVMRYQQRALLDRSGIMKPGVKSSVREALNLRAAQSISAWTPIAIILMLTPNFCSVTDGSPYYQASESVKQLVRFGFPAWVLIAALNGSAAERSLWRIAATDAEFAPFVSEFNKIWFRAQVFKWFFAIAVAWWWITIWRT